MASNAGDTRCLYLELLKRTLTRYELEDVERWPLVGHSRVRRSIVAPLQYVLRRLGLEIVRVRQVRHDLRRVGRDYPQNADTMVGVLRLDNIQRCIEAIIDDRVEGDLIEAGVWRGGVAIFMRAALKAYDVEDRNVWLADSFQGLPAPNPAVHPADLGDTLYRNKYLAVSRSEVERRFSRYHLLDAHVLFLEGWFADTLPHIPADRFALVRLDGDMFGSTMDILVNLYPKLSIGGYLIVDDYHLAGCRAAVTEYRADHGISEPLVSIDESSVYWRKETGI